MSLCSYAVLAAEIGGRAVAKVNEERSLSIIRKGKTAEGKDEFLTKADLVSDFLILDTFRRFPGIHVSLILCFDCAAKS